MAKSIDQRVGDLEQVIEDLPGILNIRFAQAKTERDEIKARVASVDAKVEGLNARMSNIELSLEQMKLEMATLPRVIGQIISEHLKPA